MNPERAQETRPTAGRMSPAAVSHMIEHTEAAAYADLLRAAPPAWGCVAEQSGDGWFLFAPTLDLLLFNRLVGWGLDAPASHKALLRAIGRYREANLMGFGVQVSPEAKPTELTSWLEQDGLARRDNWSKVYRAAGEVPEVATDLRVERIDAAHADAFGAITCAAFGMPLVMKSWTASIVGRPGWHHYLAFDGSEPVAAAALFVRGEAGWLGVAGTLPAARRRGAQGALMARRLEDGSALGCRWFVTETGQDTPERPNPSFHNMVRLGFAVAYHRPNYLLK